MAVAAACLTIFFLEVAQPIGGIVGMLSPRLFIVHVATGRGTRVL